ncbi:gamma-glutamylcyclotransferase [Candidatus Woesearchaeota archaeon]|nr:gamma-glutamylcyclotransferase [Candidatus Woesearchaeota archaeon]
MVEHFIFGYGSLINTQSRTGTSETGKPIPVRIKGVQREWNIVVPDYHQTGLGVIYVPQSTCNGVIVPVTESGLAKFDERELKHGYEQVQIERQTIEVLTGIQIPAEGDVLMYITKNPGSPSDDCPIAQSYLDVVVAGCLEFGDEFAREFIATTQGWEHPWVNDRANPRYRGTVGGVPVTKIDQLLDEIIPEAYKKRKVNVV